MGADLYIEPLFSENQKKNKRNFNRAVKDRDSVSNPKVIQNMGKIDQFLRVKLNLPQNEFADALTPIPENMELPEQFEAMREDYNKFVKAQARVNKYYNKMYEVGYFRDSYNGTSLFRRLGMSWWQCTYIDEDGVISPENAKKLLAEVKETELPPITFEELKENNCSVSVDEGINSVKSWNKYFLDKKESFCAFLQEAIDKGLEIRASV